VEGGGKVHASFVKGKWADRLALFLSPKLMGGAKAPTWLEGVGGSDPNRCPRLRETAYRQLGEDLLFSGRIEY